MPRLLKLSPGSSRDSSLASHGTGKGGRSMGSWSGVSPGQLAPFVHILGLAAIICMVVWTVYYRGGFALTGSAVFNIHPVLMLGGFIFISGEAILAFKVCGGTKQFKKAVHLYLQGLAILLAVIGILAALKFHNDNNIPNFYSLHSWLGILTVLLYFFQWVLGFITFWYPGLAHPTRRELVPWHIFCGLAMYVLALVSVELGLLEKLTFLQKAGVGIWSDEAMFVNYIGLMIFVFGVVVMLTAIIPNPKKQGTSRAL